MTPRPGARAVTLVFALLLLRAAAVSAQAQPRSMFVSVLDDSGAPVPNLGTADFIVREDNLTREVLSVAPADAPMQIAVLVDNSAAARDAIRDIREAVTELIKGMTSGGVKHELAIVGLADRPTILSDYSSDPAKMRNGVGRIFSEQMSGTYLLDALIETSRGLEKREAARPVIVAITTQGVEFSNRFHDQVRDALQRAGVAFHAIVLGPPGADNITDTEARERAIVLDEGTRTTGGRYDNVLVASALPGRLRQVAAELRSQYLVTYARPQSLIPPEHITVSAARPGLVARGTPVKAQREGRP